MITSYKKEFSKSFDAELLPRIGNQQCMEIMGLTELQSNATAIIQRNNVKPARGKPRFPTFYTHIRHPSQGPNRLSMKKGNSGPHTLAFVSINTLIENAPANYDFANQIPPTDEIERILKDLGLNMTAAQIDQYCSLYGELYELYLNLRMLEAQPRDKALRAEIRGSDIYSEFCQRYYIMDIDKIDPGNQRALVVHYKIGDTDPLRIQIAILSRLLMEMHPCGTYNWQNSASTEEEKKTRKRECLIGKGERRDRISADQKCFSDMVFTTSKGRIQLENYIKLRCGMLGEDDETVNEILQVLIFGETVKIEKGLSFSHRVIFRKTMAETRIRLQDKLGFEQNPSLEIEAAQPMFPVPSLQGMQKKKPLHRSTRIPAFKREAAQPVSSVPSPKGMRRRKFLRTAEDGTREQRTGETNLWQPAETYFKGSQQNVLTETAPPWPMHESEIPVKRFGLRLTIKLDVPFPSDDMTCELINVPVKDVLRAMVPIENPDPSQEVFHPIVPSPPKPQVEEDETRMSGQNYSMLSIEQRLGVELQILGLVANITEEE